MTTHPLAFAVFSTTDVVDVLVPLAIATVGQVEYQPKRFLYILGPSIAYSGNHDLTNDILSLHVRKCVENHVNASSNPSLTSSLSSGSRIFIPS